MKKIGLIGFSLEEIKKLNKKITSYKFLKITEKNFFNKNCKDISALIILFEYPVKKKLPLFFSSEYKFFKKLKWVHLSRAGVDTLIPHIKNYEFKLTSGKGVQSTSVSEHCIALLLLITRGIMAFENRINSFTPTEISEKKVLIIGYGEIGKKIAKRILPFGSEISCVSKKRIKDKIIKTSYRLKKIKRVISNFDIVINCLPATPETKNFFNYDFFNKMKKKSIFLCISRDQTINIHDLKVFLKRKKFLGVGIDNTGSFSMKNKVFFDKKYNFILTNHQAGQTDNFHSRKKLCFENLKKYLKGKKLKNLVSTQKYY
jgi:phosphoglycerate dehydrogenase-like enzyme